MAAIGRGFLARLARAHHAALRIELVERLGDAVEVEFSSELDTRPAGSDHRRHDRFNLVLQAPLEIGLALLAGAADRAFGAARPVGEQIAGLIDD